MDINELKYAKRLDGISGSAIREILKLTAKPGMISFAGGNPGAFALPDAQVGALCKELLSENGKALLQYGMTEGYPPLRESLPAYIREEFAAEVSPDEILPVTGSTQAMDLLCRALIDPGDVILVESPTFLGNMQCMRLAGAKLVAVPSDDDGIDTDALEAAIKRHHPKMLYVIPTFQNPTGATLSLARRKRVAELAEQYGVLVAEDDPYRALRYAGESLPSIKSFDASGWVTLLGSFSKVISPGLRVGFLAATPALLRKCVICKQSSDVHTANLNQAVVDAYLRRGLLAPHVKSICQRYGEQMRAMLQGLSGIGGIAKYTKPEGGLFIFASLPEGESARPLFEACVARGVAFVPGSPFYPDGGHENTFRLNFSNSDIPTIERGLSLLAECIRRQ